MKRASRSKAASAPQLKFDESDGPLISVKELAQRVDVDESTVRRWMTECEPPLPRAKRFGRWRTKVKWYEEWLAAQN